MTGSRNKHLLAPAYGRAFEKMAGVEVDYIYHPDDFDARIKTITDKIIYRLNPRILLGEINKAIIKKIDIFQPDILWIFKGMEIFPETLEYAKSKGVFLSSYNPDHPFKYVSRGSGNSFVKNSIPLYDLHFSYSKKICEELYDQYSIRATHLPFGYDIPYDLEELDEAAEINKVCFVGFRDDRRSAVVRLLGAAGISVDVYGPGWENEQGFELLKTHKAVVDRDYWLTLRKYRVQLNIFRDHNFDSHNMRSFEIPAVGGIMVAPKSSEHDLFFKDKGEYFSYTSNEDLISQCKHLLGLNFESGNEIRRSARKRCVDSGYSYSERASFVIDSFVNAGFNRRTPVTSS